MKNYSKIFRTIKDRIIYQFFEYFQKKEFVHIKEYRSDSENNSGYVLAIKSVILSKEIIS